MGISKSRLIGPISLRVDALQGETNVIFVTNVCSVPPINFSIFHIISFCFSRNSYLKKKVDDIEKTEMIVKGLSKGEIISGKRG